MKTLPVLAAGLLLIFSGLMSELSADERGKLIFQDDFERNESQEKTDEVGNGWGTNSKTRAGGHKQVDLKDGAMYITLHAEAEVGVIVDVE